MKNKDWREQFKQEFGIHFSDSEFSFAIASTESLLKSKQEEIEEKISRKRRLVGYGSDELEQQYEDRGFNSALDDLKPIVSNILK